MFDPQAHRNLDDLAAEYPDAYAAFREACFVMAHEDDDGNLPAGLIMGDWEPSDEDMESFPEYLAAYLDGSV